MSLDRHAADAFAERLRNAERDGSAAPLASEIFTEIDWEGARRIALARDELRRADGDECIGYKLGWTSAAMRDALGIDRPNWGTLWRSQLIVDRLALDRLHHAKVEPEIVYTAGARLDGTNVTAEDAIDRAHGWAVGIEVVNPRWASYDFTWLDNTADNSSAAAVIYGPAIRLDIDPCDVEVSFSDGVESRSGSGAQAMGSPAEAVAWLARQLASEGQSIEPGQIVFTGGLTSPFDVEAAGRYVARSAQLDGVAVVVGA